MVFDNERKGYNAMEAFLAELKEAKDGFQQYLDPRKHYLGEVVFGSGLHRTCRPPGTGDSLPTTRDWALIRVTPGREGDNKIFTYGRPFLVQHFNEPLFGDPGQHSRLFKSGRSSQFTEGMYSQLRQVEIVKTLLHGKEVSLPTFQHTISPSGPIFAEPGDAGSFIYTQTGEVVGLLVGGWERTSVGVFQPISDLFEDIKAVTGAVDVRIMSR